MKTDLETITATIQEMQVAIADLRLQLTEVRANARGHADGAQPHSARAEALAEHTAFWEPIRARWPSMRKHPSTERAYREHCQTFGKEPEPSRIREIAAELPEGRYWWGNSLATFLKTTPEKAKGIIFFMKALGIAEWVDGKGCSLVKQEKEVGSV